MKKLKTTHTLTAWAAMVCVGIGMASTAQAAMHKDKNGNVGYDTVAECDAAVANGSAKFYEPFTSHEPLKRAGEESVKQMKLKDLVQAQDAAKSLGYDAAGYAKGSCDLGVGRSQGRDGVSAPLQGKYIPYSPDMAVNVYYDSQSRIVRAMMQQCDNNFAKNLPRPLGGLPVATVAASECYAMVLTPAKFETKTEEVVKVPATKRYEPVPATYKTVSEEVLVKAEVKRQFPVAATYKTVSEEVVVRPAGVREEPVPATYKMVSEQMEVKAASKRLEIVPATYKTVTEQVLATAERKVITVTPAVYGEAEESVVDRPATTRVETKPATFKTVTEEVVAKPESVRYEPLVIPLRKVSEQVLLSEGSKRLSASQATYKTETERVLVKEASKRLVEVPAVFETVTERVKLSDATKEWKRGRAYIGQAIDVRPLRGFVVGADGKVAGSRVEVSSAAGGNSKGVVDTQYALGNNNNLDDDVMCLVAVPEQFQTITRQVVKTPASTREIEIPAEYGTVTRQVINRDADSKEVDIPATYQTVTRTEIDVDKLKSLGYKFDDKGDITAMPNGDRVLRAGSIAGMTASRIAGPAASGAKPNAGGANDKTAGAKSGEEAYVREIVSPAVMKTVTRQEIDQAASVRTIEVPGTSKTVKRRIVITPASTQEETVAATYKTVSRQVVDQPASTKEIVIPAVSKAVERRVVDVAATTRQIPVAAVTETIKRRVVDTPASVREEVTPAVYKTVTRQVVDVAASTREIDVPEQKETLSYQVKTADASTQRRAILCETNATPVKIKEIQTALKTAGYNPGPINGVLRAPTMAAVNQYQQANRLPVDGFLNLETVKALGVSAN